ncbi:MAG: SDR family oxidoreductase, partial [Myxococcales bacterium]|nr:SDR family oxidoreductase [Myxococcales bacterium]
NTLGQVVDHLRSALPASAAPAATPATAPAAAAGLDLEALLLDVVADKTGYPADMLEMGMALESDLGIDSIKRVEILSAVRDAAPGLPEVDTAEMAKLNTLGQVVDHLRGAVSPAPTSAPEASPAPAAVDPVVSLPALGRFTLTAVPTPPAGMSLPGLDGARVAVVPQGDRARALARALAGEGLSVDVADQPSEAHTAVIHVGGWSATDDLGVQRHAFLTAKAVAPRFSTEGGLFVTVQTTGGDFGLAGSNHAWVAGLAGLVKTVDQEWPQAHAKAIDVDPGDRSTDEVARAIAAELLHGGPEVEVGLTPDGGRLTLASVATAVAPTRSAITDRSGVVASGGAKGVTAHTLVALAEAYGGRYALLGRTALMPEPAAAEGHADEASLKRALLDAARRKGETPSPAELGGQVKRILGMREIRGTMGAIEAAGGQVTYHAVDVADADDVARVLTEVRKTWGPITALVHGAGVLADKLVADKTPEQFDRVFDTKVLGLRALLAATADDPLDTLLLFSSVAGRCGNKGQADYAMANEVLAKVAALEQRLRGPDVLVKALQWGPWEGGMVTPQLKAHFAAQGVPLIGLDAGAQMLVDEAADRSGATEMVLGGEPRMQPLADGQSVKRVSLALRTHRSSHPYLADHQVAGVPVVPVVMVLEWFARAAAACRPDLQLQGFREVKVLRGIQLSHFDDAGDWFGVTAEEVSNGTGAVLSLQLTGASGQRFYSAFADLSDHRSPAPSAPVQPDLPPADNADIYDGRVLFHGADFQVIRSLDGASDDALAATLTSTAQAGWSEERWHTDPAALDGGLQLALLYGARVLGGASLPMSVDAVRTFRPGPGNGPLRAVLRGQRKGSDKTITDIVFTDESGAVVHELRGVHAILRPA